MVINATRCSEASSTVVEVTESRFCSEASGEVDCCSESRIGYIQTYPKTGCG
jgi:hypothetical protein